jgi:hypothetical protein
MSQAKRTAKTIKIAGRKYIVVHTSVARIDHKNVALQLIKRAGKKHWFTLENGDLKRHRDFWAGLEAYSTRQDALGLNPTEALPLDELQALIGLEVPQEVYGRGEMVDSSAAGADIYAELSQASIHEELKTATVELKPGDTDFRQRKYPEEYTAAAAEVTHAEA